MKKTLGLLLGISMTVGLIGCKKLDITPKDTPPKPTPNYFTHITYEVKGTGSVTHADITYGDKKWLDSDGDGVHEWEWLYTSESSVPLPKSYTEYTCTGHPVKLGSITAQHPGTLTLIIKDEDKIVAQKDFDATGFLTGGNLEYSIPSP